MDCIADQPNPSSNDLYLIHEEKARTGLLSIHPARWLALGKLCGWPVFHVLEDKSEWVQVESHRVENWRGLRLLKMRLRKRKAGNCYFASNAIAQRYRQYVPDGPQVETAICDLIHLATQDSEIEYRTPAGRSDCMCATELIETKRVLQWKHGMGQLLAYSAYHLKHTKILHLFGSATDAASIQEAALFVCDKYGIVLRFQEVRGANFLTPVTWHAGDVR